jgi:hypothetical protein
VIANQAHRRLQAQSRGEQPVDHDLVEALGNPVAISSQPLDLFRCARSPAARRRLRCCRWTAGHRVWAHAVLASRPLRRTASPMIGPSRPASLSRLGQPGSATRVWSDAGNQAMPGLIPRLPVDVVAVSCRAEDTHNWKIWRKVHSVSVGLDSRKYSAFGSRTACLVTDGQSLFVMVIVASSWPPSGKP